MEWESPSKRAPAGDEGALPPDPVVLEPASSGCKNDKKIIKSVVNEELARLVL